MRQTYRGRDRGGGGGGPRETRDRQTDVQTKKQTEQTQRQTNRQTYTEINSLTEQTQRQTDIHRDKFTDRTNTNRQTDIHRDKFTSQMYVCGKQEPRGSIAFVQNVSVQKDNVIKAGTLNPFN